MSNELKITVSGKAGAGKTTLATALQEFLIREGFSVSKKDEDAEYDAKKCLFQQERIEALKSKNTRINIETVQVARAAISQANPEAK